MTATLTATPLRELTERTTDGLTITLYWRPDADPGHELHVQVSGYGHHLGFDAPAADADLAFNHPFSYQPDLPSPFDDDPAPAHDEQPAEDEDESGTLVEV